MSDTPETDALARAGAYMKDGDYSSTMWKQFVHIDDARKLEKERNEERSLSAQHHGAWHAVSDERDYIKSKLIRCEAERDQLKRELQAAHMQIDLDKKSDEERDQLRKVCDELARDVVLMLSEVKGSLYGLSTHPTQEFNGFCISKLSQEKVQSLQSLVVRYEKQDNYNSLPHVIERNKAK